jgi:hypothetical protein
VATAEPNVLRVGEQFTITYESNQNIGDIDLPDSRDFQFLGGPSVGQSTQIESSPGRTFSKTTYTYTYYFRALKEGKFSIPAATAHIKNKTYSSNTLVIEVVSGNSSGSAIARQPGQSDPSGEQADAAGKDDVFVRILLNKKEAYVGEQIIATVKIYTKLQISGIDERYKGPDFTGFYTEPIEVPPLRNLERENIDGDIYYTGVLQKVMLIPQKTGELTIQPFELDIAVRKQVKRRSTSIFDEFFEPSVQDIPVKLKSNKVVIKSTPLPSQKPVSFTGAVGEFTFNASVDKTEVKTNDAVNLKMIVKGTGNYRIIDQPPVSIPPEVESYDPVIKVVAESTLKGMKSFEYLLIPHYPGEFIIPSIEFTYFDIIKKQYRTLRSESFTIKVEKGEGDSLLPVISGMAKADVELLRSDISFIKLKVKPLPFKGRFIAQDFLFYLLYLFLFLIFGLILWLRRNHIRRSGDILKVKNRKASHYARRRLKKAGRLMRTDDKNAFFDELLKAIWLYLSDKLVIPLADLSMDKARISLKEAGCKEEVVSELADIINQCEFIRYASASATTNKEQLFERSVKLIAKLQQELG